VPGVGVGEPNQRRRRPRAAQALRETREDGWVQAAPGHPWLAGEITGDPGHVPARPAVAVDGKERKRAKAGGKTKVHLLAAITHSTTSQGQVDRRKADPETGRSPSQPDEILAE